MPPSVAKPYRAEDSSGGPLETEFILERLIGRSYTMTLVKVGEVQAGGTGPVGFLSATDLIQQMNGNNEGIPNQPMENLPYFRLQGGGNAIIIDPKPGDIGLAVFARRDISDLKQSKTEGPPPSLRQLDVSDGLYIGGLLNGAPSQWIQFLDSGISIKATGTITIDAPRLKVSGEIEDAVGTMQLMRDQYNAHIGHLPSGGSSPSVPMEESP
jgi:hypothetical protein